jgi:heme exporter protein D
METLFDFLKGNLTIAISGTVIVIIVLIIGTIKKRREIKKLRKLVKKLQKKERRDYSKKTPMEVAYFAHNLIDKLEKRCSDTKSSKKKKELYNVVEKLAELRTNALVSEFADNEVIALKKYLTKIEGELDGVYIEFAKHN